MYERIPSPDPDEHIEIQARFSVDENDPDSPDVFVMSGKSMVWAVAMMLCDICTFEGVYVFPFPIEHIECGSCGYRMPAPPDLPDDDESDDDEEEDDDDPFSACL
jgi:hypothetical protein